MLKMLAPIFFVLLMAESVGAVTLQATGGVFGVSEPASWEPGVNISGDGWTLHGFSGQSCCLNPEVPTITFFFHADHFTLGGVTFTPPTCCDSNSSITISHGPWAPFPPLTPGFQPFVAGDFTFTGHVGLAGGFDVFGVGLLYVHTIPDEPTARGGTAFTYFVPEAPSAALIMLALLGFALVSWQQHHFGKLRP